MNRRSFLRNSALALFGFTVLPPAQTYQRVWRAERKLKIYWQLRDLGDRYPEIDTKFRCVMEPQPEILTDSKTALDLRDFFDRYYEMRKGHPQPEMLYA